MKTPIMIVPDFDRTGGYERQAFFLARHFVRKGLRVRLVTNVLDLALPPYEVREGVRIHRLSPLGRPNLPNLYASFLLFLRQHRHEFDVLHCHAFTFLSAICVPIGRLLGKPVVVKVATERDIREFAKDRPQAGMGISWFLLKRASKLLAISQAIRDEFDEHRVDPRKVVVCPNGVDTSSYCPAHLADLRRDARAATGASEGDVVFAFSGRLVKRKAVDVLLRAFARMTSIDRCRLVIAGDGEEAPGLRALATKLGINARTRFVGEVADVRPHLASADAFVFPSRLEGLPNALLEAMACALPPIVARIGGCVDVVDEANGIVFDTDNIEALTKSLDQLANSSTLRSQLGQAARARILEAFSFEAVGTRLQQIYQNDHEGVRPPATHQVV